MPPNKPKLYKNTGKLTVLPPVQINSQPSTSTISPELEQKFEIELCWCIQQLQTALKSGKLNNRQVQDHTKSLNTLMSNSAPMVKKRTVMRSCFGDYREKMAAEEKKTSRNAVNMKVKPATPSSKSVFVKKSAFTSSTANTFKFNFESPDGDSSETTNENKDSMIIENYVEKRNELSFVPSDNSFRFGFTGEDAA
ncbi:hypothetical protein JTB14_001738 [Gonioctena quinquepunctata]|nr:hypothetical protein JTB14_001738 [Gonioctena quinquepunctata]